jgi:hydroxymethylpyrimidine pyrophosphatase-like HAD family hydrolase
MRGDGRRTAYLDLDGTLLAGDGRVVADTLDAIAAVREAGWRPALLTGRSRPVALAIGRLLGVRDVVCELGALVRIDGRDHRTPAGDPEAGARIDGAPELPPLDVVLDAIVLAGAGPVQEHEPGSPRAAGFVLRAAGSGEALTRALAAAGLGAWHAVDNGPSHLPLAGGGAGRVVHVLPRGVDKRAGVLTHRALRGLASEDCVALGDSPADLDVVPAVGRFVLVAGDPVAEERARALGLTVTTGVAAAGALEAARTLGLPVAADA